MLIYALTDSSQLQGGIPRWAFHVHRRLSPKMAEWAEERLTNNAASQIDANDVSGTEWPAFGSVFYLWATESLQSAWEQDKTLSPMAPKVYAHDAISATTALVLDPGHATWVIQKWGHDHLERDNCFYRMMLVSAMTSYQSLTGDRCFEERLRDQVTRLVHELETSPSGLIEDYPGECWPTDVITLLAAVQRADSVLGTDHSEFLQNARRAFQGPALHETGLPPYMANARSGAPYEVRGSTSQWGAARAPYLWPEMAPHWYEAFTKHFWQTTWGARGFREYPQDSPAPEWTYDVDAGPILAGYAGATTTFAIGAARANGRFDHADALAAEVLAFSWPIPNGTLLIPRILSDGLNAPYVGEAAFLYNVTKPVPEGASIESQPDRPGIILLPLMLFTLLIGLDLVGLRRQLKTLPKLKDRPYPKARVQFCIWLSLIICGIVLGTRFNLFGGVLLLGLAHGLPYGRVTQPE